MFRGARQLGSFPHINVSMWLAPSGGGPVRAMQVPSRYADFERYEVDFDPARVRRS
jgi:hypothetical protein